MIDQNKKKKLIDLLKQHKIASVESTYDGSGDDGQITEVRGYPLCDMATVKKKLGANHERASSIKLDQKVLWVLTKGFWSGSKWEQIEKEEMIPLEEVVRDFCHDILEESGFDWVNNDGGYGTITLDTETGVAHLDHHQRIMSEERYEEDF